MASQFPPKKNTAFTLFFTLYKNDGTIIANPGTITKKVSIDGAAVADITAAVTEEDTTYGQCSVVLSTSEMNGDAIWIYIKDDTAGCVPFTCTIYTAANLMDDIKTDTAAILADTGTDGVVVAAASKTGYALADSTSDAVIADAVWNAATASYGSAGTYGESIEGFSLTAGAISDAVWDEAIAGHSGVGSTGAALAAAGGSGDPWATSLPGAYGAGTAGKLIGDNINAPIATIDTVVDGLATEIAKVPKNDGVLTLNATCSSDIKSGLSTQAELNKVPKSDGASTWNATALASINAEVDSALNTAIPGSPTADSINERIVAIDAFGAPPSAATIKTAIEAAGSSLAQILEDTGTTLDALVKDIPTNAELTSAVGAVTLANGAHGGASATITAKSISVNNGDAGGIAVTLTGSGTGNSHALSLASTSGSAISAVAGSHAVNINSSAGNGLVVAGATGDIVADITGTIAVCTTNTDLVTAAAIKTAMEADGGDLSSLMEALVNKLIITEADGAAEIFNDAGSSQGTVAACFTSVAGFTKRERLFK